MASISLDGVTKEFPDGTKGVCDLDLRVEDGEFMILVGPSGSGKSTALRIVAGLEEATEGDVRIGDRVVNEVEPRDRDLAMVFQSYALYPHKTVEANMGFALKMSGVSKAERAARVREVAEMLGISELLGRRPGQLSGGQRQRVALGRAIVRKPQAFLMDEPLSNLDAKLRVEMRTYIGQLHHELGVTTVYVTHDQVEAMTMGDRVAVMRDGKIVQVDTPQALYDSPADLFVAGFMGSPAMNLVRARLSGSDVVFGSQKLTLPDSVMRARSGLASYEGREIVLGIRPETVDVSLNGAGALGQEFTLPVVVTEALGSDLLVHLDLDAESAVTADMLSGTEELTAEEVATTTAGVASGHARLTARLGPRVRATPGQPIKLKVEPERLHFFDPETEAAIR
jgi:multiple sugar transport system ATP-binding protein